MSSTPSSPSASPIRWPAAAISVLATLCAASGSLASPQPLGLLGRWTADLGSSDYDEATLGPKPRSETLEVRRDDGRSLALSWTVVDAGGARHVETFEAPLSGRSAAGTVDGQAMRVTIMRMSARSALITTSLANGRWDYIIAYLSDAGALTFRQDSFAPSGSQRQMTFVFRRAD